MSDMGSLFGRLSPGKKKSADQAKERLKFVLIHDRTDLSPAMQQTLKEEILAVISKHVSIDPDMVKISMTQQGREQKLIADIPLLNTSRKGRG